MLANTSLAFVFTGQFPLADFPVIEFMASMSELPSNKDLIFYCASGGRSIAAALMASQEKITKGNIYHIENGIMGFFGHLVSDYPRIKIFEKCSPFYLTPKLLALFNECISLIASPCYYLRSQTKSCIIYFEIRHCFDDAIFH